MEKRFRILSLDGGGSKGLYTLGVLREIEALLGEKLYSHFDLVYGTSTGSIIAASIASGKSVQEVIDLYLSKIPSVMSTYWRRSRSKKLFSLLVEEFDHLSFNELKTDLGVVATNYDDKKPFIFKSSINYAHGRKETFVPGFGVSVAEAVTASCSAYPFFDIREINTKNQQIVRAIDGGFCANNPSLFALADAVFAFQKSEENVDVLSIGVGTYPEKYPFGVMVLKSLLSPVTDLINTQFESNSNSMEALFKITSKKSKCVRINDTFFEPDLATSLFEMDPIKLNRLISKGRDSYALKENEVKKLLDLESEL